MIRTMVFKKGISKEEKMKRVRDAFGPCGTIEREYENLRGDLVFALVRF